MFSKKNKTKNKEDPISTTSETRYVTQTSKNFTVQTTTTYKQRRSESVSYSSNVSGGVPSGSQISLPALSNSLLSPTPVNYADRTKSSSFNNFRKMELDAKPVNLNYQSPYRNSPVYSSFQAPKASQISSFPPITTPKKPVPVPIAPTVKVQTPVFAKEPPPQKLVVKKTGKIYDTLGSAVPTYKTSSKNRGEVLIINNIMFKGDQERKGAKVDDQKLEDLFKQIGFKVQVKRDLKRNDMRASIQNFSKKSSLKSADISVVVVMSHGTKSDVWGTQVFGCDDQGMPVEDILQYFAADKCKYMQDKPKIFIFQCCRGDNEQFIESDATVVRPRPYADMLIAYSTLPGFVSHRDPVRGTWYIQTLCDVFSKHAHEYHVEELLKIVDVELARYGGNSSRQTSSYESRGFKKCYFHPV